jgi:hypothetical protein
MHQEQEFVIGDYTKPEGARKHFGALLVGFYEGKKLKFAGRVGTGFSEKLLRTLFSELIKIQVEKCPFFNLAVARSRWDQGLTAAEMKRCHWVKPAMVCQVKFTEWTRDNRLQRFPQWLKSVRIIAFAFCLDGGVPKSAHCGAKTFDSIAPNPEGFRQSMFQNLSLGIEGFLGRCRNHNVFRLRKNQADSLQNIPSAQPALL